MYFLLLCCFCLDVAILGAKFVATKESKSIIVTFHFHNEGNCRLFRVALQNDKKSYSVVKHSGMPLRIYLERWSISPMDTCVYENLLQQTSDPLFLVITTGNKTILTCTIKMENKTYNIENYKLQFDKKYQLVTVQQATLHMVYGNQTTLFNKINYRSRRSAANIRPPKYAHNGDNAEKFYLELYLVVDEKFCTQQCTDDGNTLSQCEQRCPADRLARSRCGSHCKRRVLDIVNRVHAFFRKLNIYVVLVGLDFVAYADIVQYGIRSAPSMLYPFLLYVTNNKTNVAYDVAHFMSGFMFSDETRYGAVYEGTVCIKHRAFGITVGSATTDATNRSVAVTNIIANSLNIARHGVKCPCYGYPCNWLVTDFTKEIPKLTWSRCFKNYLQYATKEASVVCLGNKPEFVESLHRGICGNGVVDTGEECDNGNINSDTCCNMTTCRFQGDAKCASGACCNSSTCEIKSSGSECSIKKNECDVAEICDGQSEWCPEDQHKKDHTPCDNAKGTCYKGQCGSKDIFCKLIFGINATAASDNCYDGNVDTNAQNGFCNVSWSGNALTTAPCSDSNKMCGQLNCNGGNTNFLYWLYIEIPNRYKLQTIETAECKRRYFYIRNDIRSPFMVPNGSPCSNNGTCIDSVCKMMPAIKPKNNGSSVPSESDNNYPVTSEEIPEGGNDRNYRLIAPKLSENNSRSSLKNTQTTTLENTVSSVSTVGVMHTGQNEIQRSVSIIVIGILPLFFQCIL